MKAMKNIFSENGISLRKVISEYTPCPVWERGRSWDIDKSLYDKCIKNGEQYLSWEPEVITASDFMLFFETGDRILFEGKFFKRRSALASMMYAECVEANGRFIKKIIDLVWLICEESTWGLPASIPEENGVKPILPDKDIPSLELFACETGNLLAYTLHIMGGAFDEISPMIRRRIEDELERRIINPYLKRNDYTWMNLGGSTGSLWKLSNWTPWCHSNCLSTVLIAEKSAEKRRKAVEKLMEGIGNFIYEYPEDGGCDEGCGYWSRAAGSVLDCLELLYAATGGEIDIYHLPKIKNMGEYISDCYAGSGYFVNFADAGARVIPEAALVYRFGEKVSSDALKCLGRTYIDTYLNVRYYVISQSPMRIIPTLFDYGRIKADNTKMPSGSHKVYKNTQVCMVRPSDKWFFAAKGGYNNESHNHNDVGSFVLYYDEKPVFIDSGAEAYCAKTFSDQRYEIWTMQSDYHNLPKINGVSQKNGEEYKADFFDLKDGEFICQIQGAYPKDACVNLWERRISGNDTSVFLTEHFEFTKEQGYEIVFMTPIKPENKDSRVILGKLEMLYDKSLLSWEEEDLELEDAKLKEIWGKLYRIVFKSVKNTIADTVVFEIKKLKDERDG